MSTRNGLHRLAAGGAVLVGTFLMMGAYGHIMAVLPVMQSGASDSGSFALSLPGVILATAGVLSVALCKALWDGRPWALNGAIVINALALIYFSYLLWRGLPGHPVAMFTGVVACNTVLLLATRFGLVWPLSNAGSATER